MSRVVVLGLGRFGGGAAAARWFAGRGDRVVVTDLADERKLGGTLAGLADLELEYRLGSHDPADFEHADVVVVNPAIPFDSPLVAHARAHGARIVTEIGLTLDLIEGPVAAVTGTNGKSTAASLAAAMLEESGVRVVLGGNIGHALLTEAAGFGPATAVVLELSSFQLAWLEHDRLAPRAAAVTNVTGDHFDRHPDFAHYAAAKERLARAVPSDGLLALRHDDATCRGYGERARARVVWFGPGQPEPVDLSGLRLLGPHNRANAAAAAHLALALGADADGCARAAARFRPLPHRMEVLGEKGGVLVVDDAVCTSPEATAAAVSAFERPVVLLVGGRDKGLARAALLEAARRARVVVCYGETGPSLAAELPGALLLDGFDEAVGAALSRARSGDVVLLSPGFASYDQFPGFDRRGARFRELVAGWL